MKKQKNFKEVYKETFQFIRESKNFIFAILLIFSTFVILGYFISVPSEIEKILLEKLREISIMFEGAGLLKTIWLIFSNNIYVCFISILFGFLFGIFPLIASISNGFILGYVANKAVHTEGILTLWKLFPHGIFELPAVLLSMALGIKLGTTILFNIKSTKKELLNISLAFLLVVTPLLIIAAIIEGALVFLFN